MVIVEVNTGFMVLARYMQERLRAVVPPITNVVWVPLDKAANASLAQHQFTEVYYDAAGDQFATS